MASPEQAIIALWDDGWTIAQIAEHLDVTRGAAGVVIGDLLRERRAARPALLPAPAPAPIARPPVRVRRAPRPAPPPAPRRAVAAELVAVPLLTRDGLAEIARRHGHGRPP